MALLRRACFTINNYSETEESLINYIGEGDKCSYMIVGKEVGKSGTPHLQGYICLSKRMRLNTLRNLLGGRAHIESARGTPEDNKTYCSKEGNFKEWGIFPKPGERSDIASIKARLDSGENLSQVVMETTSFQQLKFAENYSCYVNRPNWKREAPKVYWIWGPTGVGKTKLAVDKCKEVEDWENSTWISGGTLKWWQGYRGQKCVIIDEFRKDYCTFHYLLRITDRYPMQVEYKGGSTWLQAEMIVFTSCYPPQKIYDTREDIDQLLRRITEVIQLGGGPSVENKETPAENLECSRGQRGNTTPFDLVATAKKINEERWEEMIKNLKLGEESLAVGALRSQT